MRPALAIATGAVLLAGTLVVTAPAALLDTRVSALSAGQLRLVNAAGTIWNGSGELVLLPAGARQFVRWQLAAWPLLRGEIRATIARDPEGASTATVVYGHDRLELRSLEVERFQFTDVVGVTDALHRSPSASSPSTPGATELGSAGAAARWPHERLS